VCIVCGVGVLMGNRGGSSQNFSNVCSTAISFSEWIHHRTSQMFALQPFQIVKVLTSGFWRISTMWRSVRVGGVPVNNRGGCMHTFKYTHLYICTYIYMYVSPVRLSQNFSKVSSTVILYSKFVHDVTFENFYRVGWWWCPGE